MSYARRITDLANDGMRVIALAYRQFDKSQKQVRLLHVIGVHLLLAIFTCALWQHAELTHCRPISSRFREQKWNNNSHLLASWRSDASLETTVLPLLRSALFSLYFNDRLLSCELKMVCSSTDLDNQFPLLGLTREFASSRDDHGRLPSNWYAMGL